SCAQEYGRGSGKDCRMRVQTLNGMGGDLQTPGSLCDIAGQESHEEIESDKQKFPAITKDSGHTIEESGSKWAKYTDNPNFMAADDNSQHMSVLQEGNDEGELYKGYSYPDKKVETKASRAHSMRLSPYKSYQGLPCVNRSQDPVRCKNQQSVELRQVKPASTAVRQQNAEGSGTSRRPIYSRLGTSQLNDDDFSVDF
ncbi:unnamed protein product, partial [Ixodes hexagonus]